MLELFEPSTAFPPGFVSPECLARTYERLLAAYGTVTYGLSANKRQHPGSLYALMTDRRVTVVPPEMSANNRGTIILSDSFGYCHGLGKSSFKQTFGKALDGVTDVTALTIKV